MPLINSKQIKFTKDVEFLTASQIKNLAEGTLATDAVNKSQLSAAEAAATAAVAAEAALRAAADLAINVAAAAESAARIAGDSAEAARATAAESVLTADIATEKGRVDAILSLSDADKNSFTEIVALINSVDATNDSTFAGYVVSNNAALDAETAAGLLTLNKEGILTTDINLEFSDAKVASVAAVGQQSDPPEQAISLNNLSTLRWYAKLFPLLP